MSTLYSDVSQDVVISDYLDDGDKMTRSSRPLETISTFLVSKNDKYYEVIAPVFSIKLPPPSLPLLMSVPGVPMACVTAMSDLWVS